MPPIDWFRAALVGVGVLVGTLIASVPMVAVYAHVINPGQPQAVYGAAAQWIAPWSSHIVGPLLFLWWNYRSAVRRRQARALTFASAGIAWYLVVEMGSVVLFGLNFSTVLTVTFFLSLSAKTAAALLGAWLGQGQSHPNADALAREGHTNG
jgi:hypothetical protein